MVFPIILLIVFAVFFGYAMYTQFSSSDPTKPMLKRVLASLLAAAASLGAAVMGLFQKTGGTP